MSLYDRVESGFEAWGYFVCRHRWSVTLLTLASIAAFASSLPRLTVDFSNDSYLHPEDPAVVLYDDFREQFDADDRIVVAINPPDVFDLAFLEKLRELHRELEEELPYTDEVLSLVNARLTRGEADELIVEDLLEDWPETAADLEALRARVLANPVYINSMISRDATFTSITIKPYTYSTLSAGGDELAGFEATEGTAEHLTPAEYHELVARLVEVVERYRAPDFPILLAGFPVLDAQLARILGDDAVRYATLSFLMIAVLLFALFRRVSAVVLPVILVVTTVLATFGIMVSLGIYFSTISQMIPTLLMAIGICDAVHILAIVYQGLAGGRDRDAAIAYALRHSGVPVVMTSLTTAGGLLSFFGADIAPVSHLGLVAPIGVLLMLFYSLTLLPALLAFSPRSSARRTSGTSPTIDRLLARIGDLATRHPWRVLASTGLVLLLALGGVLRLRFSQAPMDFLPKSDPTRRAMELVDDKLEGTSAIELLINSGRENGLHEPEVLRRIESALRSAEAIEQGPLRVATPLSLIDIVKETHQALNENRPDFYVLPSSRPLIAQELLLFENSGSDDLEQFSNTLFSRARVRLRAPMEDQMLYPPFLDELEQRVGEILGDGIELEVTGETALFARTMSAVIQSMARSYVLALLIITPMIVLLIGNLRRGLLAMIPNLIPIFIVLGVMGWTGIALNLSTMLMGGIVLGLAVDDTIHFMHKFSRYYTEKGDVSRAVHLTLASTGSALLVTSLVLTGSFLVYLGGYMVTMKEFGIVTALAAATAFLADVLVAPALMALFSGPTKSPRIRVR